MRTEDQQYCGLPWLKNGRSREGCDCAGLAWLWLKEQAGLTAPAPRADAEVSAGEVGLRIFKAGTLRRGDAVFFRHRPSKRIRHVAIYLGDGKVLTTLAGAGSRIENGWVLLRRLGFEPVGTIAAEDTDRLARALADPELGWTTVILLVLSFALSYAISYLSSSATTSASDATTATTVSGKYSANTGGLATAKTAEIPLPDILGTVVVAGNCVYQQLPIKDHATTNSPPQAWNQVIVLESAPSHSLDYASLQVNGLSYQDSSFHSGSNMTGIALNPGNADQAVIGNINGDTYVPSVTLYHGSYGTTVPVDPRAGGDRSFPVYGFSGTSYLVFRLFDSSAFASFNVTIRVKGRRCRKFDEDGFLRTAVSGESLTGANGSKVRFKLAQTDIAAVSAITVNGTAYAAMALGAQTGNVYHLNKTKGFVEFMTAPAAAATILVSYTYFPRAFTQNPALHIVYLLTEPRRGKAFPEDRIDWAAAVEARDYYDETVAWTDTSGVASVPRYQTNYSIDTKKTVQDHLQVLLDACHSALLLVSGKFILTPIKDGTSVFSFDTTTIMVDDSGDSTFKASLQDRASKANRVKLSYYSEDTLNSQTDVIADDEANQAARSGRAGDSGVVETDLTFYAVTNYAQAARLAETLVREYVNSNWLWTWKTNIQGLALMPGDLVDVTHPSIAAAAKKMRIESLEYDENDRLTLTASEYVENAYF